MGYVRFVLQGKHPDSGSCTGLFELAYELRGSSEVTPSDRKALADVLSWFDEHLELPDRFNRSRSKGYYRRSTRGISWFRDSATKHIAQMRRIQRILESYGHSVRMLSESRIGYVVYEDDVQAIAEPFSNTETG